VVAWWEYVVLKVPVSELYWVRTGAAVVAGDTRTDSFTEFFADVQPRLNRALVAALGTQDGLEATQEALAWGWEHWDELGAMNNPAGYLYRVGRSRARRLRRRPPVLPPIGTGRDLPWVEPGLPTALARLSEKLNRPGKVGDFWPWKRGWSHE